MSDVEVRGLVAESADGLPSPYTGTEGQAMELARQMAKHAEFSRKQPKVPVEPWTEDEMCEPMSAPEVMPYGYRCRVCLTDIVPLKREERNGVVLFYCSEHGNYGSAPERPKPQWAAHNGLAFYYEQAEAYMDRQQERIDALTTELAMAEAEAVEWCKIALRTVHDHPNYCDACAHVGNDARKYLKVGLYSESYVTDPARARAEEDAALGIEPKP